MCFAFSDLTFYQHFETISISTWVSVLWCTYEMEFLKIFSCRLLVDHWQYFVWKFISLSNEIRIRFEYFCFWMWFLFYIHTAIAKLIIADSHAKVMRAFVAHLIRSPTVSGFVGRSSTMRHISFDTISFFTGFNNEGSN